MAYGTWLDGTAAAITNGVLFSSFWNLNKSRQIRNGFKTLNVRLNDPWR